MYGTHCVPSPALYTAYQSALSQLLHAPWICVRRDVTRRALTAADFPSYLVVSIWEDYGRCLVLPGRAEMTAAPVMKAVRGRPREHKAGDGNKIQAQWWRRAEIGRCREKGVI